MTQTSHSVSQLFLQTRRGKYEGGPFGGKNQLQKLALCQTTVMIFVYTYNMVRDKFEIIFSVIIH